MLLQIVARYWKHVKSSAARLRGIIQRYGGQASIGHVKHSRVAVDVEEDRDAHEILLTFLLLRSLPQDRAASGRMPPDTHRGLSSDESRRCAVYTGRGLPTLAPFP